MSPPFKKDKVTLLSTIIFMNIKKVTSIKDITKKTKFYLIYLFGTSALVQYYIIQFSVNCYRK